MILWLDDDINRSSLKNFVETIEEEFEVIRCTNPKDALAELEEKIDQINLFIVDIIMPTSNLFDREKVNGGTSTGIELVRLIKNDVKYKKLPVMFYSIRYDQKASSYAEQNNIPLIIKQRTPLSEFINEVKKIANR